MNSFPCAPGGVICGDGRMGDPRRTVDTQTDICNMIFRWVCGRNHSKTHREQLAKKGRGETRKVLIHYHIIL